MWARGNRCRPPPPLFRTHTLPHIRGVHTDRMRTHRHKDMNLKRRSENQAPGECLPKWATLKKKEKSFSAIEFYGLGFFTATITTLGGSFIGTPSYGFLKTSAMGGWGSLPGTLQGPREIFFPFLFSNVEIYKKFLVFYFMQMLKIMIFAIER